MPRKSSGPWWLPTYSQGKGCWVTTIKGIRYHLNGDDWLPESDREAAQAWWLKLVGKLDPDRLGPKVFEPGVPVTKTFRLTSENAGRLDELAADTREKTGATQPNENTEVNTAIELLHGTRFKGRKKKSAKSGDDS